MNDNSELLTGMSIDELAALADGMLAPSAQARLDELLSFREEKSLPPRRKPNSRDYWKK